MKNVRDKLLLSLFEVTVRSGRLGAMFILDDYEEHPISYQYLAHKDYIDLDDSSNEPVASIRVEGIDYLESLGNK